MRYAKGIEIITLLKPKLWPSHWKKQMCLEMNLLRIIIFKATAFWSSISYYIVSLPLWHWQFPNMLNYCVNNKKHTRVPFPQTWHEMAVSEDRAALTTTWNKWDDGRLLFCHHHILLHLTKNRIRNNNGNENKKGQKCSSNKIIIM